ncbi:MAG: hypothetical protein QOF55_2137 [Thermoleophilaceae bacterium]|nr:hypothetical protein [Thermoleophilaceae bacterium]
MRRALTGAAAACAVAALAPAGAAQAAPPRVAQLVVFKNGDAHQAPVTAASATAHVGGKRCAVGAGTALAALLRSGETGIGLKDYGACSSHPTDAGGLYVARIRKDAASGANGWVYKVGNKVATAGAGDPSGPFGHGRLKPGTRVTWFFCHMKAAGCQRTLTVKPEALGGGQVRVTVRAYDDRGKARPAKGATVHVGTATATAGSNGVATLASDSGVQDVYAEAKAAVRSFQEQIEVR